MFSFILTLLIGFGGLHAMDTGTGPVGSVHIVVGHPHLQPADTGTGPTG